MESNESDSREGYTTCEVTALHEILINENPRVGLWIDSSDMTPEERLYEIIKRAELEAQII